MNEEVAKSQKLETPNELVELIEFKKKSGWSYEKIGQRMGIHSQTVVFWITGKHKPSSMAREKIRKFLDEFFIKQD